MPESLPLDAIRIDEIRRIAHQHGIIDLRIFGSRATRRNTAESDLDLLVELEPGRDLLDLVGFKQDLESNLGCPVDVLTRNGLSPYLRERILQEASPL